MNKIKLYGKGQLATDEEIMSNRDYGLLLIASRISEERTDDEGELIYKLKISHIDSLMDLKTNEKVDIKEVKFTKSQRQRLAIEARMGKDEYDSVMDFIYSKLDSLLDDYINKLN